MLPWTFDWPNGHFNDNICLFLTKLMSKIKYLVPFLSNIPLVLPRKNLTGFSVCYLGLLTGPTVILLIIYARFDKSDVKNEVHCTVFKIYPCDFSDE